MNNKGFTLVELIAVLVILTVIMTIALPSISSSMERTKVKQDNQKKAMLVSYSEMYVTDHKNAIYNRMGTSDSCYITVSMLIDGGYLTDDASKDASGNAFTGYIIFKKPGSYEYKDSKGSLISCM